MNMDPIAALATAVPAPASPGAGDRGAQARLALIHAGIHEFGEYGPDGASTRRIAQRAGQNIASISYYFGGKEGLYLAITHFIVEAMRQRTGALLDEIEAFLDGPARPPARCLAWLQRLFIAQFQGGDEVVPLSQMIVREQTHPTGAFDILFKGWLERPHRLGARLIAAYVQAPDADAPEFIVHYHMLLGSVLAFRVARQTLLQRLGVSELTPAHKDRIAESLGRHTEHVLKGLRLDQRRRQAGPALTRSPHDHRKERRRHP